MNCWKSEALDRFLNSLQPIFDWFVSFDVLGILLKGSEICSFNTTTKNCNFILQCALECANNCYCRLLRRWNGQTSAMNRKFIISLFKKFDKDVIHNLLFDHQVKKSPFLDVIFSLLFQYFFGCIWLLLNPRKKRFIEISKGKKMNQHVVKMIKNCILLLLQCFEGVPFAVPRYLSINPKIIVA